MIPHKHKFAIADQEAVQTLVQKLVTGGSRQKRREKLLDALDIAMKSYTRSSNNERKAFFHGLLTGYAVALKLW